MPRRSGGVAADAAAASARHRLTSSLGLRSDAEVLIPAPAGNGTEPKSRSVGGPDPQTGGAGHKDAKSAQGRFRWGTPARVAVLVAVAVVLFLGWLAWQASTNQAIVVPLGVVSSGPGVPSVSASPADPPSDGAGELIVVHVAGAVLNAGIVKLATGSRVFEAIAAAGGAGPEADLNQLNLAETVQDGQKIHVPRSGEALSGADGDAGAAAAGTGGSSRSGTSTPGAKVNLNTATAEELGTLPRVGPVLAQRIVDWRKEHGPFKAVEELDAVDGVGPKMLEALLPLVAV